MKTVAFTTLGCRVNQYDTDAMKGLFLQNNYEAVDFDEKADIYVINTCSVTNMGGKEIPSINSESKTSK
nr:hypothetical protein [Veillonella rogosae]